MRRPTQLATLIAIAGLSTLALTPLANGATHRPAAPAKHHKYPPRCKPKFHIAAEQKLLAKDAGLYSVVTADNKHSYAVGSEYNTGKVSLKFDGLIDEGTGSNWSLNDSPGGFSLKNSSLNSVAASDNDNVWTVGETFPPKEDAPVVLHKTKSGWNHINPSEFGAFSPRAVITRSSDNVWIGGSAAKGNTPEVFHFDGKKWKDHKFSALKDWDVTGMTFLGKKPALVAHAPMSDKQSSVVLLFSKGQWKSLAFGYPTMLTGITGTSKHNIWVSSDDESIKTDQHSTVYHFTKSWLPIYVPDLAVWGLSSRSPVGTWLAGFEAAGPYAEVDVYSATSGSGSTQEFAGDGGFYYAIDAHTASRVLAVGITHDENQHPETLIEQAVC